MGNGEEEIHWRTEKSLVRKLVGQRGRKGPSGNPGIGTRWPEEHYAGLEGAGNDIEELLRGSQGQEKGERGGWEVGKDRGGGEKAGSRVEEGEMEMEEGREGGGGFDSGKSGERCRRAWV